MIGLPDFKSDHRKIVNHGTDMDAEVTALEAKLSTGAGGQGGDDVCAAEWEGEVGVTV